MADRAVHVVPESGKWGLKHNGTEDSRRFDSRGAAVDAANDMAADEGLGVVLHREDGTFEAVVSPDEVQERQKSERASRRTDLAAHDILPVFSRVSWSAVLSGSLVALAIYAVLGVFGVAIGLTAAGAASVDGAALAIGSFAWQAVSVVVALFIGGCVASRATAGETSGEPMLYGVLVWSIVSLVGLHSLAPEGSPFVVQRDNLIAAQTSASQGEQSNEGQQAAENQQSSEGEGGQAMSNADGETSETVKDAAGRSEEAVMALSPTSAAWSLFALMLVSLLGAVAGSGYGSRPLDVALRS